MGGHPPGGGGGQTEDEMFPEEYIQHLTLSLGEKLTFPH